MTVKQRPIDQSRASSQDWSTAPAEAATPAAKPVAGSGGDEPELALDRTPTDEPEPELALDSERDEVAPPADEQSQTAASELRKPNTGPTASS